MPPVPPVPLPLPPPGAVAAGARAVAASAGAVAAGAGAFPPVLPPPAQAPLLQFLPLGQTVPQVPQLLLSADVFTQVEPHSFRPPEHPQLPPLQTAPAGQTLPQLPQLFESFVVLVQAVPHCVCPELQLELHWLLLQTWPDEQDVSAAPAVARVRRHAR